MSSSFWIIPSTILLAALIGVVIGFWHMRGKIPLSPRQVRRSSLLGLLSANAMLVLVVFPWQSGFVWQKNPWQAVFVAIWNATAIYGWLRKPSPIEEMKNFAADRLHCGRCEYNLTGNISGVCPECGWSIPRGDLDVDSPGWALWWREWKIPHLGNWRHTLTLLIVMALTFLAMAIGFAVYLRNPLFAVMPAVMALHLGVNAYRVLAYAAHVPPAQQLARNKPAPLQ